METTNKHLSSDRLRLEYLFEDHIPDPGSGIAISDYDTLDFVSGGSHIYGEIIYPDGTFKEKRPVVILVHGLPGTARNDDIAHALVRIGCVVLTPHHRGAWGSEGYYTLSHNIEDVINLVDYVTGKEFTEKFNTDPNAVFLFGHSMGGNTTVNAYRNRQILKGLILMAPFDPAGMVRKGYGDSVKGALDEFGSMNCINIERSGVLYENIDPDWCFINAFENFKDRNLMILDGKRDDIAPYEQICKELWTRLYDYQKNRPAGTSPVQRHISYYAQHGLIGARISLIRDIAEFIRDCLDN